LCYLPASGGRYRDRCPHDEFVLVGRIEQEAPQGRRDEEEKVVKEVDMTYEQGQVAQQVMGDELHRHSHDAELHAHDHYHVSHHHTGGPLGEFEHRAQTHSHEHNHAPLMHAHERYDTQKESEEHAGTAHVHDHNSPTGGGL
jgi:hypothetical protein